MNTDPNYRQRFLNTARRALPSLIAIVALVGIILVLSVLIGKKGEAIKVQKEAGLKKERPPVNVVTLQLTPIPIRDRINLPGITAPWIRLEVMAEVSGKVVEKPVEEGQSVKEGTLLVKIDDRDYRSAYQSAAASYDVAVSDLKRLKSLFNKQAVPQSRLDEAEARAKNTRAAMDSAGLALERTRITAHMEGIVNRLRVEEGQFVNVGDPIAELLQVDRLKVRVGIPESDVDAVRRLDSFEIRIDALGGKVFKAKKYFLSRTADSSARVYDLELELDNRGGEILPDMFARVDIVKREVPDGIAVPIYSIITRDEGHIVYVTQDGTAHRRQVELGLLDGWQVEVTKGLAAGEKVIVVGHRSVNDGDPVNEVRSVKDPREIVQ